MSKRSDIERAVRAGVARAFRNRALVLRERAVDGFSFADGSSGRVMTATSESRDLLDRAQDWDDVAAAVEKAADR
jgi:hypothetical protein